MKKALPYILIGAVVYYFWWKKQQDIYKNNLPSPPQRDGLPLETEDGSPLIKYGGGKKISGIPTIF